MTNDQPKSGRGQIWGFLVEAAIFALFLAAVPFMLRVHTLVLQRSMDPAREIVSNWELLTHLLLGSALVLAAAKHWFEGRPPLYLGHFDAAIVLLFGWLAVNVYYSEIRSISWRTSALCINGFAGFLLGRLVFFHRLRGFGIALLLALLATAATAFLCQQRLLRVPDAPPDLDALAAQVMRIALLFGGFWIVTTPFLFARKPNNILFLLQVCVLVAAYAAFTCERLGWILTVTLDERHERFLAMKSALGILRNYPLTGCGAGTLPMIFESYKLSPNASFGTGLSLLVLQLVETGIVGVLLLVYPLARFPLYIIRRWRLFPNRQLRMAVFCMLGLAIILLLQVLYDSDMGAAGAWFLAWTHLGILTSLVMVRDPMRIFDAPFVGARRAVVPHEETGTHGPGPFMPQPQARRRVSILAIFDRRLWSVLVVTVLIVAACGLAALPYAASTLARRRVGEELSSYSYGQRVAMATRIFPLQSGLWAKLAAHLQQSAGSSIEMYERLPSIEAAYQRAIRANPYDARNYEQLAFLYSDTNNPSQAIKTLKLGVQNNPNHFVLRMLLVRELEKAGSLAMATHHVKQALFRIDPEQVELYLRLAELYDLRGMKDKAFVYYLYARQVVPDSAQSQVRLRRLRERFGIAF